MISTESNKLEDPLSVDKLDQRDSKKRGEPVEQPVSIPLREEDPTKIIQIGSLLSESEQNQLVDPLRRNVDVFACSTADMSEILLKIITHQLNIDPKIKPVRQKKRSFAPKR